MAAKNGLLPMKKLDDPNRNDHEKCQYDDHHFSDIPNKGDVRMIWIGHNNKGEKPGWRLDYVYVEKNIRYSASDIRRYAYKFTNWENDKWLATTYGDGEVEREICSDYALSEGGDIALNNCTLPYEPVFTGIE